MDLRKIERNLKANLKNKLSINTNTIFKYLMCGISGILLINTISYSAPDQTFSQNGIVVSTDGSDDTTDIVINTNGIDMGGKVIDNVMAGDYTLSSATVVNSAQMRAITDSLASMISGNVYYNGTYEGYAFIGDNNVGTKTTGDRYLDDSGNINNINDAFTEINEYVNAGFKVKDNSGTIIERVAPNETMQYVNGTGTTVSVVASEGGAKVSYSLDTDTQNKLADVDTLKTDMTTVKGNITTLTANVGTNTSDIATLKSDVSTAKSDITTLKSDMTTVKGDVTTLTVNVATNTSDITTLKSDVSTAKSDIITLKSDVTTNKNNITTLTANVGTNTSDIATLKTDVATNTSDISTLKTDVTNKVDIATYNTDKITIQSELDNKLNKTADNLTVAEKNQLLTNLGLDNIELANTGNIKINENNDNKIKGLSNTELKDIDLTDTNYKGVVATQGQLVEAYSLTNDRINKISNELDSKVNRISKETKAGIAGVTAIATMPSAIDGDKKYGIVAGAGYHNGGSAVAVGFNAKTDDNKFTFRTAYAYDNQKQHTVGIGVGYQFGDTGVSKAKANYENAMKEQAKIIENQAKELNETKAQLVKQAEQIEYLMQKIGNK